VLGRLGRAAPAFGARQSGLYGGGDPRGDLVLQVEDVGQIAVVALGPEIGPVHRVEELAGDAHAPARLAHAALQHVANTQLRADLRQVDGLPLVGEGGIAGDDQKPPPFRQRRDDVLGDAVDEISLLGVASDVVERQNGNGWPIRQRARRHGLGWR
jgi:hypothetical protein